MLMLKNIIPKTALIAVTIVLASCATSDIVQIGNNYIIFKEGGTPALGQEYRLSRIKAEALSEANQKCQALNKTFKIIREDQTEMSIGVFARYELEFTCI